MTRRALVGVSALLVAATLSAQDDDGPLHDAVESLIGPLSRVEIRGRLHAGVTLVPDEADDRQNFGRLFDDRPNEPRLNALALTVERPFEDPLRWDWAFKIQASFGSDARFTHGLGLLDEAAHGSHRFDVVESWVAGHAPILGEGGVDLRLGTFATLCGLETMDPTTNPALVSHGYLFNFGVPFKHTGALATWHAVPGLDLHAGIVSGINTTLNDNNDAWSFHGGANATLVDGDLAFGLGVHHGPENPEPLDAIAGIDSDDDARTIVDLVMSAKPFDFLTVHTDLNYGVDEAPLGIGGETPEWYGVSQWLVFHIDPAVDVIVRGEVFRDDDGFAVAKFAAPDDYADVQAGLVGGLDPRTVGGGAATYYGVTLGVEWRPDDRVTLSAELRADFADGSTPFRDGREDAMVTFGLAVLVEF